jgi:hypothetical protein
MNAQPIGQRHFRCTQCGFLLGIHRGHELHIKYKDHEAIYTGGTVRTTCRRCCRANEATAGITTPRAP